ncbi:hypothetical protein GE09DRAFT_1064488 [Coniochaeta sp. 2T2.1]|nr:hypothetical protein GE09DRAFT_1064488 [Coniochaeta sp. 2T2.1]
MGFFTPTSTSPIGQQPLPIGLQLKSPLDKHKGKQFILKDIIPGNFDYILSLQKHVEQSRHIRTAVDNIPKRHILVFPYLEQGLLHIDTAALSSLAKKVIIRNTLTNLANLYDKHIIHTDIKPTNIIIDSFKTAK